jgi:hypothetical protein
MPFATDQIPEEKNSDSVPARNGNTDGLDGRGTPEFLIGEERYMHRFDRSQTSLLIVRTYQASSGECYSRTSREPWQGL